MQIKNLLEKKRLSRMKMSANPLSVECIAVYRRCVADVQRECRIMKDKFWERIADKLDLPLGTVKSRIFFTRKKLCRCLSEYVN